jgi:hypothetical protein
VGHFKGACDQIRQKPKRNSLGSTTIPEHLVYISGVLLLSLQRPGTYIFDQKHQCLLQNTVSEKTTDFQKKICLVLACVQ